MGMAQGSCWLSGMEQKLPTGPGPESCVPHAGLACVRHTAQTSALGHSQAGNVEALSSWGLSASHISPATGAAEIIRKEIVYKAIRGLIAWGNIGRVIDREQGTVVCVPEQGVPHKHVCPSGRAALSHGTAGH